METRWLKKEKQDILPGPAFVAVTVKEELEDVLDESDEYHDYENEASTPKARKRPKTTSNTNTCKSSDVQPKLAVPKRHRCTQVVPEDIDLTFMKESDRVEMLSKGAPIELPGGEEIVPQCRICLRRVARENLEIILAQHKKKARVAFQIRVFPHDAYPFICVNCQNMLDMFFEFKRAIIKAKNLLVSNQAHMESNGWDDQENVDLFKKCKQAIVLHRLQIDSLEEQINPPKPEYEGFDDANNSGSDNEDINNTDLEPMIKPECVINEDVASTLSVDGIVSVEDSVHDVVETRISNPKVELPESADDDSMDEDYKVEDDDDADEEEEYEPRKFKSLNKEKKVRIKKSNKDKPPQIVTRQLCDFCGEYIRPESVESHRNKHLGIKPYICSVEKCETAFSSRYNLSKHIKKFHKPGGVGSHTCNICGKVIQGSIGVLKYHQKRHNIDQKSHICPVCGKGFTMKWYLTQHSIIHTGEFPHKCKYCGKRFNNKWSMKTHEKNIHEKKNLVTAEPKIEDHQNWNPANFPQLDPQNVTTAPKAEDHQNWNPGNFPQLGPQNV